MDSITASIKNLEELSEDNSKSFEKLSKDTANTLQRFEDIKSLNAENLGHVHALVESNTTQIDSVLKSIAKTEENNEESVRLFAECASKNEMLFNDLYSFVYQLKAIFDDLAKQKQAAEV